MRAGMNHRKTVLLVEDNGDIRFLLRTALELDGYRVVEAANGREGVERACRERPDLVLMDLTMPLVDGLTATRQLRRLRETRRVPVIAVSANDAEGFYEAALAAGCDEYITKPFDFDRLNSVLGQFCPAA